MTDTEAPTPSSPGWRPTLVEDKREGGMAQPEAAARAITAFKGRRGPDAPDVESVWAIHAERSQRPFAEALASGDTEVLLDFLRDIHATPTFTGYDFYRNMKQILDAKVSHRRKQATTIHATLLRTAAAVGALRHYNPEQTENIPYLHEDHLAETVPAVAERLGLSGPVPLTSPGSWGLRTTLGPLTLREAISLGYVREIRDHLAEMEALAGRTYGRIVEIGGGLGRVAFHGARDLRLRYDIIDLPLVSLTQFLFLEGNGITTELWPHQAAPRSRWRWPLAKDAPTEGDEKRGDVAVHDALRPLTAEMFRQDGEEPPLFVNFDSFVEMSRAAQDGYFQLIAETGGDLLSVNHEAANPMGQTRNPQNWDLSRITSLGLRAGPRRAFWERDGYVTQYFLASRI
ncbi:hypothetical protein AAD018_016470 [Aestuariibius insulae]|uniref:hypothetical protein n=1 Tax=Aestuariibius insulae TaxID=2058287 RepID=UPI00345EE285